LLEDGNITSKYYQQTALAVLCSVFMLRTFYNA